MNSFTEKVIESSRGTHFRTKLHWIHLLLKHYWVHRVHTVVSIQNTQTDAQRRPIKGNWTVPLVGQLYIYLYTVYKDSYNWSQILKVGLWWGHAVILIYSWIEGGSAYDRIGLWTSIYGSLSLKKVRSREATFTGLLRNSMQTVHKLNYLHPENLRQEIIFQPAKVKLVAAVRCRCSYFVISQ